MKMEIPDLPDHEALTAYVRCDRVSKAAAAECIDHDLFGRPQVRYPCLGPPLPNQPKVCKAVDKVQGVVCGVGGHISNTHEKGMSLATRALTHSVWLLENMRFMAQAEATKQAFALVHVLSALEMARQQQMGNGFHGAVADLQSILIMYGTVREWFFRTYADHGRVEAAKVKAAVRDYRSTINVLNEATAKLMEKAPVLRLAVAEVAFQDVENPRIVLYCFPSTTQGPLVSGDAGGLWETCNKAFANAPAAWKADTVRMLSGHVRDCSKPESCACNVSVPTLKVRSDADHVSACKCCGFVGHNKHSCASRNTATHIAVCLATLVDSTKSSRITPRSAHLSLYHCYHAIVALLYRWWSGDGTWATDDWSIQGLGRLRRRGTDAPELLLRLFNHVALELKANARMGETMLLLDNRGVGAQTLHLEAAHNYDLTEKRKALPQTKTLKRKARKLVAEAEDDALVMATQPRVPPRPPSPSSVTVPMSPTRASAVRELVQRSARVHPGLARDLSETSEIDIAKRFGLDNIVWTELV